MVTTNRLITEVPDTKRHCRHEGARFVKEDDGDLLLHCPQCQTVIRRQKPKQEEKQSRRVLLG